MPILVLGLLPLTNCKKYFGPRGPKDDLILILQQNNTSYKLSIMGTSVDRTPLSPSTMSFSEGTLT